MSPDYEERLRAIESKFGPSKEFELAMREWLVWHAARLDKHIVEVNLAKALERLLGRRHV